ncbi:MAG: response regulator [Acidimicrobiia bacterium]|nr:response regulator [Acidimicrobiia bacterium]NNF10040.1 response regulator [Acidimicrobiia bacterium]NNL69259.1 response regulator [Acidimicrobiia bacterium]
MAIPQSEPDREARLVEANLALRRELESLRSSADEQRDRLESRLIEAVDERDHARAALDKKAEALAHMSHELRTPMNGILGMTRLALQTELSQKQREYLEVVNSSADALLTLINDILDLSKLDAGRLTLETIPFDLRDTVDNSIKSISTLIADKGLLLDLEIDQAVPAIVVGDPGRLRQVLLNLVSNAVKFTETGTVRLHIHPESDQAEGVHLHFAVIDEGIGIRADRLSKIFEPYLQASDSTTREFGGTGLGLAICRDLVELMGGRIWAESEEGKGSAFHFTARFESATAADDDALAAIDELAHLSVYVLAEESPAYALAQQLDPAGIRPSLFSQPSSLYRAVVEHRPDIVIVDLDATDLSVVSDLDEQTHTIVVTSSGQRGDAARCRELGVAAYLTRPLGPLDLRDAVRAVIHRSDDTLITRHWLREHRPRLRVLAADDSASNRLIITQMLELQDHDVVTVSDGAEAVDVFEPGEFDLILMDMEMPTLDGAGAARALRRDGVTVPIIALTGHSSPEQIRKCLDAGMNGHLTKPFEFNELMDTIESAVKAEVTA